jgi:hypothetical protein
MSPLARLGSSFDDFLKEDGVFEETEAAAIKKVIAAMLDKEMAANNLGVEQRARIVESLLELLTPPDEKLDRAWLSVARARLDDLRSGRIQPVSGEAVFERILGRRS